MKTFQGSKPKVQLHKGVNLVDPISQATDNSGSRIEQSTKPKMVRLHKSGKLVNPCVTDNTGFGN